MTARPTDEIVTTDVQSGPATRRDRPGETVDRTRVVETAEPVDERLRADPRYGGERR